MCRRLLLLWWLAPGLVLGTGCELLEEARESRYETVAANPKYDTATAESEHAKALKIVSRHLAGQPVNLAQAEAHLQKALVADVTFGPAHNTLGTIYMRQRKFYVAAWEFEYAAKLMPDRYEPLYNLGQVYESADKLDNAIVYYEQALGLSPRNPRILGNVARAQLKSGKAFEEVRPLLQELVFLDARPEWIEWARDELGRRPVQTAAATHGPEQQPPAEKAPESLPALPPVPATEEPPRLSPPKPPEPRLGFSQTQAEIPLPEANSAEQAGTQSAVENAANSEPVGISSASDDLPEVEADAEPDSDTSRFYSDWAPLLVE